MSLSTLTKAVISEMAWMVLDNVFNADRVNE